MNTGVQLKAIERGGGHNDDVKSTLIKLLKALFNIAADGLLDCMRELLGGICGASI